jgi:hypothetical protein
MMGSEMVRQHWAILAHAGGGWAAVNAVCRSFTKLMAKSDPERFVANMSMAGRKGRMFPDYLRDGQDATICFMVHPGSRRWPGSIRWGLGSTRCGEKSNRPHLAKQPANSASLLKNDRDVKPRSSAFCTMVDIKTGNNRPFAA